jgi:adenosylcobinamide-GDP ribazoletransferase
MIARLAHEGRLVVVAMQYFTRLPMPTLRTFESRWLAESVRYFPLAGLVVGLVAAATLWGASHVFPRPVAAALALVVALAITGAFHEDGLADTFDALGGHVPRERALEIMRDSRIGTYGACALALALLLRWLVIATLPPALALAYLVAAHPVARATAAALMATLPYVRLEADAKAKPVAEGVGAVQLVATLLVGLAPALAIAISSDGMRAPLAAGSLAAVLVFAACRRWLRRRLGGYTGDGLGCTEQLAEIAFGLAMLATLR